MQSIVCNHGHKLQTLFQKGHYFETIYQQQLSRLPTTVSTLKVDKIIVQFSWKIADAISRDSDMTVIWTTSKVLLLWVFFKIL